MVQKSLIRLGFALFLSFNSLFLVSCEDTDSLKDISGLGDCLKKRMEMGIIL